MSNEDEVSAAETSEELAADLIAEAKKLTRSTKIVTYVLICVDTDDEVHTMAQSLATASDFLTLKALHVAGQELVEVFETEDEDEILDG